MIQVLGLRHYGEGAQRKIRETFFNKGWRLSSVADVFKHETLDVVLAKIPAEERFNLYYTVANSYEERGRKMREQWAIPFDIDGMVIPEEMEMNDIMLLAKDLVYTAVTSIGVDPAKVAIVFSGHGVQFFILLDKPFVDKNYFKQARPAYTKLTGVMQKALTDKGLAGHMDNSVWSEARLMRLPATMNKKDGKVDRQSFIIQSGELMSFDLVQTAGVVIVEEPEQIDNGFIKSFPTPDKEAVCNGCKFLVQCKTKQAETPEPLWYAALSILVHLPDGEKLAHEYSEEHPNYSQYEVDEKIKQAKESSGPRTCKDIEARWNGCHECEHYGKITSPILIRGKDYIVSRDFGYRQRKLVVDNQGNSKLVAGKPEYEDLIKAFRLQHPYKVVSDNDQVIVFIDTHWKYMPTRELKEWMTGMVTPEPSASEMAEFVERLKSRNVTSIKSLNEGREGLMNFTNCVLNMRTFETYTHDSKFGFFEVRPYAYDPRATSPTWDKFVLDIMSGQQDMADTLNEFAGYAISGDEYWLHKAMILNGSGENGKSVFMEILGEVVGNEAHSTVPMQDLSKPTARKLLENKVFNYSEETSTRALYDSEIFKTLASGGSISIKQLYVQEYSIMNRTKLIMSCNTMPVVTDLSHGLLRRLLIVPFKEQFKKGDPRRDPYLKSKLRAELAGICNRLIQKYGELKKRGDFAAGDKLDEQTKLFEQANDTVHMFYNHVCDITNTDRVTIASEVYSSYVAMCEQYELKPLNIVWFARRFVEVTGKEVQRVQLHGERQRVYKGIGLRKIY